MPIKSLFLPAALLLAASPAVATTIDFNGTAPDGANLNPPEVYQEDGYKVTKNSWQLYLMDNDFQGWFSSFEDDVYAFGSGTNGVIISSVSGEAFDFFSLKHGSSTGSTSLTLTGYFAEGDSTTDTISSASGTATTYSAEGFVGLSSLVLTATGSAFTAVDDIVVDVAAPLPPAPQVPLPAAAPLLAVALGATALVARRRKG